VSNEPFDPELDQPLDLEPPVGLGFDAADLVWAAPDISRPHLLVLWVDRPLTRWERFKTKVLRRSDPRFITHADLREDPPTPEARPPAT
jgi:hypothetical protein